MEAYALIALGFFFGSLVSDLNPDTSNFPDENSRVTIVIVDFIAALVWPMTMLGQLIGRVIKLMR